MKGKHSKRFMKLEREMFEFVAKTKKPITLDELKSNFFRRASVATTKQIIDASERIAFEGPHVGLAPYTYADITYSIAGGAITGVFLDGQSGNTVTGTIFGVRLFGASFEFELRVEQNRVANWVFTTTRIAVVTGGTRRLVAPISDSHTLFIGNIPTIN